MDDTVAQFRLCSTQFYYLMICLTFCVCTDNQFNSRVRMIIGYFLFTLCSISYFYSELMQCIDKTNHQSLYPLSVYISKHVCIMSVITCYQVQWKGSKYQRKGALLYKVFCYLTLLISVYQHTQNQVIRSCLKIAMSMKHDSLHYLTHSNQLPSRTMHS